MGLKTFIEFAGNNQKVLEIKRDNFLSIFCKVWASELKYSRIIIENQTLLQILILTKKQLYHTVLRVIKIERVINKGKK